jgi:hypothetical protein
MTHTVFIGDEKFIAVLPPAQDGDYFNSFLSLTIPWTAMLLLPLHQWMH